MNKNNLSGDIFCKFKRNYKISLYKPCERGW